MDNKFHNTEIVYFENLSGEMIVHPPFEKIMNFTQANDDKYRLIYQTVNLINDRNYVGQHTTNNLEDGYIGSGHNLKLAIKKYGEKNFKTRFCCFCNDQENLDKAEITYIKYFQSLDKDGGYNILPGGKFFSNKKIKEKSEKTRKKRFKSGEIVPWNKGKTGIYSEEILKKMSEAKKGTKQSLESNLKRSKTLMGREISKKSIEKMIKTKKEKGLFVVKEETKEKLRKVNLGKKQSQETINKRIEKNRGQKRTLQQLENLCKGQRKNLKKIIQKDFNEKIIKIWNNSFDVCEFYLDFNKTVLLRQTKLGKKYKGYIWEYEK